MNHKGLSVVSAGLILLSAAAWANDRSDRQDWVAAWTASPEASDPDPKEPLANLDGQTVRERVRISTGGSAIRVRLSNEHGSSPLRIGSATVALAGDPSSVRPRSIKTLTFGGSAAVTIPTGAPVLSDPVAFSVASGAEISISLYFPGRVTTPTLHGLALKRAIITAKGDFTHDERLHTAGISESSVAVSAVLVPAVRGQRLLVAFGDSLTDGDGSTIETDRNWTSDLARRLAIVPHGPPIAVVNQGIAGNRLLADGFAFHSLGSSALARFDRDVLSVPGATHVVLLEGVNDLAFPGANIGRELADPSETVTADELIGAYLQLIARAHAVHIKVIGATLTPFEGARIPGYYSQAKEATRQIINQWIRTGGAFDGLIDFDALLRDPEHPSRMQERYVSRDHLHPNDAGYQAMADAIDISLLL